MKKTFFIIFTLLTCTLSVSAAHIKGGFFTYRYLGPGSVAGTSRYQVMLTVYMECNPPPTTAQISDPINFSLYDGNNVFLQDISVSKSNQYVISKTRDDDCITGNQAVCYYTIVEYNLASIELSDSPNGYTFAYQRCCRIGNIVNVSGSGAVGNTWAITIAGSSALPAGQFNSSPSYRVNDTAVICAGSYFEYPFGTTDPDGDSLSYLFCGAWEGGSQSDPAPVTASSPFGNPPQYPQVPYQSPFSGFQPMGPNVTIDPITGLISGVAPAIAGEYVITVCVNEFRNGILIGRSRKELHIRAGACQPVTPTLDPQYITCDGFTLTFQNQNQNPQIQTYFWDFGVPTATNDTSNQTVATYTFADTGTYTIKLVVNRGLTCPDSTTAIAKVYPGFFPGFDFSGICVNRPTQFTDTTSTQFGVVDSWRWDFGVTTATNDTSRLQNPTWTFTQMGNYNVRFIVTNSKGCVDTVVTVVPIIDKPPLDLAFRDTLICNLDNIQLNAIGNGTFSWTPLTNIVNANTATPTVNPQTTTWCHVLLDDNGCLNNDSVRVRVVNQVTLSARADTTICATDAVQLSASTDGFQYSWTPAADLDDPNALNPIATPAATTTYQITSRIGSCVATDNVTVTTVPYPIANAGPDETICFAASAQLNGSVNGSSFTWSPSITLDDPNVLTPIAAPFQTTEYVLSSFDTQGCPKPGRDTVVITVLPQINAFAGNDTTIVIGQPLQLNASGGTTYLWSPPTGLSAIDIADPVAILDPSIDSIRYRVIISNQAGCFDSAFINVRVFKTNPYIFVPTAFTPNNDGRNDVIRPIAVGMKQIEYFRVYNRWGQMVFSTQINGHGWDGRLGGKLQSTGVFVWLVKGVDYLDRPFFQKGTVTLIR